MCQRSQLIEKKILCENELETMVISTYDDWN